LSQIAPPLLLCSATRTYENYLTLCSQSGFAIAGLCSLRYAGFPGDPNQRWQQKEKGIAQGQKKHPPCGGTGMPRSLGCAGWEIGCADWKIGRADWEKGSVLTRRAEAGQWHYDNMRGPWLQVICTL
ncbi:hypothetical protein, partial [Limosilactobacillus allomucosae]|uniref:hypothetical protein n=1 Tax=Limosilactobacillus allomucosae TaxID=3142938 RepID=UPI0032655A24